MNFPVGSIVSKGDLPISFEDLAEHLFEKKFNGYVVQSVSANFLEEGVLFLREGNFFACCVECLGVKQLIKGDEALNYFLNQTKAKGVYHIIELGRSQIDLITAFDEKLILVNKIALKDIAKLIPITFEPLFKAPVEKDKLNLDDYGLGELK